MLIDEFSETVKHEIKKQEVPLLPLFLVCY